MMTDTSPDEPCGWPALDCQFGEAMRAQDTRIAELEAEVARLREAALAAAVQHYNTPHLLPSHKVEQRGARRAILGLMVQLDLYAEFDAALQEKPHD